MTIKILQYKENPIKAEFSAMGFSYIGGWPYVTEFSGINVTTKLVTKDTLSTYLSLKEMGFDVVYHQDSLLLSKEIFVTIE